MDKSSTDFTGNELKVIYKALERYLQDCDELGSKPDISFDQQVKLNLARSYAESALTKVRSILKANGNFPI